MLWRSSFYSRRAKNKIPKMIKLFKTKSSWAEEIFKTSGINLYLFKKLKK